MLNIKGLQGKEYRGNSVFSLCSKDKSFFYIEEGSVDVFLVEHNELEYGKRFFLSQFSKDSLIPNFSCIDNYDIIACTNCPTVIEILGLEDIKNVFEINLSHVRSSIELYLNEITSVFRSNNIVNESKHYKDEVIELNNEIYIPSNGIAILKVIEGVGYIQSDENLKIEPGESFIANQNSGIYFKEKSKITTLFVSEIEWSINLQSIIEGFNEKLFKLLIQVFQKEHINSIERIEYQKENKKIILGKAYRNIYNVFNKERSVFSKTKRSGNLLFDTCLLIATYERISFKEPPKNDDLSLDSILINSNIKARKIALKGEWWKDSSEVMLGYIDENKTPIALVPYKRGYKLFNLKESTEVIIDRSVNMDIEGFAYVFYTTFPSKKIRGKDLFRFVMPFIQKDILYFLLVGVISALLALMLPIITGYLFNEIIPGAEKSQLVQIAIILIGITVINSILGFIQSISILRAEGKTSYKIQAAVWDRILSIETRFFKKFTAGELAERSMAIESIRQLLTGTVTNSLIAGIFSIFYLGLMFYYSVSLALLSIALGLFAIAFTVTFNIIVSKYIIKTQKLEAIMSGFLLQIINGIQKIRTTDTQEKVFEIFSEKFSEIKSLHYNKLKIGAIVKTFLGVFPVLASMIIYLKVYDIVIVQQSNELGLGDFLAFNSAYGSYLGALIQMSMASLAILNIKPLYNMIKPILEAELEADENKVDLDNIDGNIDINNLFFRYNEDQPLILNNISLQIKSGQFVAFVGSSGSGKSTIIRLLLGFEKQESGSIFIDNNDISSINIKSLRRQIGVVLQNSKIMQGTILENIIGSSNRTIDDAWWAAKMAGCDDDIREMPMNMYTILPPGGGTLSGGQQQRIVIARALINKPKILIFDEATSALDNKTQKIVSDSIDRLNVTRIVVAHRLSTIMHADCIYVIHEGKIIEYGDFNQLMKNDGFFADLSRRQLS